MMTPKQPTDLLAEIAKLLCEPNTTRSVHLKAIKAIPNSVALQTDARVLAAIRILEHIQ
jgi:hypothetical protein